MLMALFRYHIIFLLGFSLKHRLLDRSNAKVQCLISEGKKRNPIDQEFAMLPKTATGLK